LYIFELYNSEYKLALFGLSDEENMVKILKVQIKGRGGFEGNKTSTSSPSKNLPQDMYIQRNIL